MKRLPRDPWRLLLLLGYLCQGFACNSMIVFPALYFGVWYLTWRYRQPKRRLSDEMELVALVGALLITWVMRDVMQIIWFAAIGNGLVIFQSLRSYYSPPVRQKLMTAAVAVTQIAIGAQAVFDYRFMLILVAAIVLIPRCLHGLEVERLEGGRVPQAVFPRRRDFAYVALLMVCFFLFFPRIPVKSVSRGARGGLPTGPQRPEIDMSDSVENPSDILIFRVDGEGVDYLRLFALDTFDGVRWTASPVMDRHVRYAYADVQPGDVKRTVRINAFNVTGNFLPAEPGVVRVRGTFRNRVFVAEHGGTMVDFPLRGTADYDYWVRPDLAVRPLSTQDERRYLAHPELSPELRTWLDGVLANETRPEAVVGKLMQHFQNGGYRYQLGAPKLDETRTLAQFVLEEKTGHCGRYASALAALLRASGVPSRVVVGYLAKERNEWGDFYNVRARHAHAWTEAWLPGQGWIRLDATPDGSGYEMERIAVTTSLRDWVEHMWYANIVNFGFREQESFLSGLTVSVNGIAKILFRSWPWALAAVVTFGGVRAGWRLWKVARRRRLEREDPAALRRLHVQEAGHFYGQMVRALARWRLRREAAQTPTEFLAVAESAKLPVLEDVRLVTQSFCDVRYGEATLTDDLRQRINDAIARIKKGGTDHPR